MLRTPLRFLRTAVVPLSFVAAFDAGACDVHVDPFSRADGGGGVAAGGAGGMEAEDAGITAGAGGAVSADAGDEGGIGGTGGAGGGAVCPSDLLGFASQGGSTTGGAPAASVTVSTLADLTTYAAASDPMVIVIKGMIAVPAASQPLQVPIASNKTIIGADAQSGLSGGGLILNLAQNVIIQNLVIAYPVGTDGITVQYSSRVWIDHCELYSDTVHASDYYKWLVNVKHQSDFVTVSWTRFHDHFNTVQVGHSDTNGAEDMGHLTVTFHHNQFVTTNSGAPRVRFGDVHVFNNSYENVNDYAVASQMYAQVLTEQNVFDNVPVPLTNQQAVSATSFAGQVQDVGNLYTASGTNVIVPMLGTTFTFTPPYSYDADSTPTVAAIVPFCAGPGKI
jgi:pectate lyase